MLKLILVLGSICAGPLFAAERAGLSVPIARANPFRARTYACLTNTSSMFSLAPFRTLGELSVFTEAELILVPNLGDGLDEVKAVLAELGTNLNSLGLAGASAESRLALYRAGVRGSADLPAKLPELTRLKLPPKDLVYLSRFFPGDSVGGPLELAEDGLDHILRGLARLREARAALVTGDLVRDSESNRQRAKRIDDQLSFLAECMAPLLR